MEDHYRTSVPGFTIRFAREGDEATILHLIKSLAKHERSANVQATEEGFHESLFIKKQAEVILGEMEGKPVAFALFFQSYSGFLGKAILYVEDLFVEEEFRGKGIGRSLMACLAAIADERGYHRMDWLCMDWNAPSIAFYEGLGAMPVTDMTVYRIRGPALWGLSQNM